MHQLSFLRPYLSIESFPDTELPDFTLITGMNGAGKSHLLAAIQRGDIQTNCANGQSQYNQQEIRLFDWNNMIPQDSGYFSGESISHERINYYNQMRGHFQHPSNTDHIRSIARGYGVPQELIGNLRKLSQLTADDLQRAGVPHPDQAVAAIAQSFSTATENFLNGVGDINAQEYLRNAEKYQKLPLVVLEEREVVSKSVPMWGRNELFQQSFSRLFVSYRDALLTNSLKHFRKSKGDDVGSSFSDEEFYELHGPPPWTFVNDILASAGLQFRINTPELFSHDPFRPVLRKVSSEKEIEFAGLSSGEKILMSFAFCVYYASDTRQVSVFPKLLLLDEIDAPLHPSMSRNLIDTISKTLVGQYGIRVIATTHSPSTVALTPEEAVHVIRSGEPGVHKISKSEALNVLTHGVPTLAVSFDGRRQIFVESPTDAKIYDGVYKLIKAELRHERSLDFIATGVRSASGEDRNTGCDVVRRIVGSLVDAGNKSVMGLIDWDGANEPSNRLHVLAHGKKNGLESVILDPLIIGMVIAKNNIVTDKIPAMRGLGYIKSMNCDTATRQQIVDQVAAAVLDTALTDRVQTHYMNDMVLDVDRRWFEIDDHDLEERIIRAFPNLKAVTKSRAGLLMQHIVESIFVDDRGLIPADLRMTFEAILNTDT